MAGEKPDNRPARDDEAEADGGPKLKRANPLWELRLVIAACVVGGMLLAIGLWGEIAVAESRAHAEQTSDVDVLIEDVLSENPDVRRLARDRLARIGPSVVRRLMDRALTMTAANDRLALRMQTGAAIVLDTMLIKNAASSADLGRELNAGDFNALVSWTVNRDSSLRDPAVRVVANAADVAALRSLMHAVEHEIDAAIIYNTAWILQRSAQRLRSNASVLAEIKQLARTLRPRASNANTTRLLDQIEAM